MSYVIDYGMGYFHPKLGDTIVYCSAFKHFGKVVWKQKAKTPTPDIWKQIAPMYKPFDLKIKHGKPTRSDKNFMNEMYKEGMKIGKANFTPVPLELPEKYVTVQLDTGFEGRNLVMDDVLPYTEGLPIINLDDITAIRDSVSVSRLMTAQAGAEFHVGPDSGCAWSAIAVETPVKLITADRSKLDAKRQMMHQCALNLMSLNENVEIING